MNRRNIFGLVFVLFWAYLCFFSYPSTAWVDNGYVHVINWDGFNNWYVESVDDTVGYEVVVLTGAEQEIVDNLLADGRNVLSLTDSSSGCRAEQNGRICEMEFSFKDYDYKYPLFYLSGKEWIYWLNIIAPVFLIIGLVLLAEIFMDKRFAILIIFFLSLFAVRKYIVGFPITADLPFHMAKVGLIADGSVISDLYASGITSFHYYPPLFYWIWGILSNFVGIVWTIKMIAFFIIFLSGLSAYVVIGHLSKTKYRTVAAVIYMISPFLLSDLNLRGGLSESFSFVLIPMIFLYLIKFLEKGSKKDCLLLLVFMTILILTHIPSTMIMLISVTVFIFGFEASTKRRANAFSYIILSLLLSSFWLVPLLFELNFTSHSSTITMDFPPFFIPQDWNCGGTCLLEATYIGILLFSISVFGIIIFLLSKERNSFHVLFLWLFIFWLVFTEGPTHIFQAVPLIRDVLQHAFRSYMVMTFIAWLFVIRVIDKLSSLKKFGKYIPFILLAFFIIDSYKVSGTRIHSNDINTSLFSFDGFQKNFERVIPANELIYATNYGSDYGSMAILLEPDHMEVGSYHGHQIMPQISVASLVKKNVLGPFPRESASNDFYIFWQDAVYNMYLTEAISALGNDSSDHSLKFSEVAGYLGADLIITTSDKYVNNCTKIIEQTENLFIYNNTCAIGRVSTYKEAVNVIDEGNYERMMDIDYMTHIQSMFSEDVLDPTKILFIKSKEPLQGDFLSHFYAGDARDDSSYGLDDYLNDFDLSPEKPEIDVSIISWKDEYIELEVNAVEDGFIMLRKTAYPDWELFVDGIKTEILLAEPDFISFRIGDGSHSVKAIYSHLNWRHLLGFGLSLIALVFLFGSLFYGIKKRKRKFNGFL